MSKPSWLVVVVSLWRGDGRRRRAAQPLRSGRTPPRPRSSSRRRPASPKAARKVAALVRAGAPRARSMVSRPDADVEVLALPAVALTRSPADVHHLVARALAPFRGQAKSRDILLREDDRIAGPLALDVDVAKVTWVVASLVGNALRFVRTGSRHTPGGTYYYSDSSVRATALLSRSTTTAPASRPPSSGASSIPVSARPSRWRWRATSSAPTAARSSSRARRLPRTRAPASGSSSRSRPGPERARANAPHVWCCPPCPRTVDDRASRPPLRRPRRRRRPRRAPIAAPLPGGGSRAPACSASPRRAARSRRSSAAASTSCSSTSGWARSRGSTSCPTSCGASRARRSS